MRLKVRFAYTLILFFAFNSSDWASSAESSSKKMKSYSYPSLSSDFETYNIEEIKKKFGDSNFSVGFDANGTQIQYLRAVKNMYYDDDLVDHVATEPLYTVETIPKDSLFSIKKVFDENGKLKEKGLKFLHRGMSPIRVGIWYKYASNGQIADKENLDQNFNTSLDDFLKVLEDQKIPLPIPVNKDGKKAWVLSPFGDAQWEGTVVRRKDKMYIGYEAIPGKGEHMPAWSASNEKNGVLVDGKTGKIIPPNPDPLRCGNE